MEDKQPGLTREEEEQLDEWFTYHAPTPDQIPRYNSIRSAAKLLARTIMLNAPASKDRSSALRKLRQSVMIANAAIALRGK
jgi:hypothetical protein